MGDSESSDDEGWTYASGEVQGLRKSRSKPPILDLDNLENPKNKIYLTREEELTDGFEEAGNWVGIIMSVEDFRKFIWSHKETLSENAVIYADIYDNDRRKAIKYKVEKNVNINREQMNIDDYYITSKGGYIAWVKTDRRLVSEIHRRAAKSSLKSFRTTLN